MARPPLPPFGSACADASVAPAGERAAVRATPRHPEAAASGPPLAAFQATPPARAFRHARAPLFRTPGSPRLAAGAATASPPPRAIGARGTRSAAGGADGAAPG